MRLSGRKLLLWIVVLCVLIALYFHQYTGDQLNMNFDIALLKSYSLNGHDHENIKEDVVLREKDFRTVRAVTEKNQLKLVVTSTVSERTLINRKASTSKAVALSTDYPKITKATVKRKLFKGTVLKDSIKVKKQPKYSKLMKRDSVTAGSVEENSTQTGDTLKQQCNIPKLDPFHQEVLPYYRRKKSGNCNMTTLSTVVDGVLHLKLNYVHSAGLYYIRRHYDVYPKLSNYHPIVDSSMYNRAGVPVCIRRKKNGHPLSARWDVTTNATYVVVSSSRRCTHRNEFVMKNNIIIHESSGRCLIPQRCFAGEAQHSKKDCWKPCGNRGGRCPTICGSNGWCCKSGHKDCPAALEKLANNGHHSCVTCTLTEKPFIKLSETSSECAKSSAKFVIHDRFHFTHMDTSQCIRQTTDGHLDLGPCKDLATIFDIPLEVQPSADVDIKFPLREELVKVVFQHKLHLYTEYHITILKTRQEKREERQAKPIDQSEMNVLLIAYDSQSRANIQRQWTKSYDFFSKDENTVIMKGHVINGDATTQNLAPLFTGYSVDSLPEARKWKKGWGYVNRWPFIFNDFHDAHYKTMYIEDNARIGAFYYRLSGFDKQPTDKYVSHFFSEFTYGKHNAPDCSNRYILKYLKNYLTAYSAFKKFAFGFVSLLSHDDLDLMHLTDDDMVKFFHFMNESGFRDNTTVIVFGDHGFRNGAYRATMQGKMEERLPFLAISLPPWFKEKHPGKMKNLRRNSEVLTTWFDMYQTLRDLINPSNYTKNRPTGESLFTDVLSMNRSCEECGIPTHYCPCLVSTTVPNNHTTVLLVAQFVVSYMNKLIQNVTKPSQLCSRIELDEVVRAQTVASNKDVQSFSFAYENEKCDRCGVGKNKNFKLKIITYGLSLRVKNYGGMFEASVEYGGSGSKLKLSGDISRIDLYGDQPKCIANEYPTLRKFCFCRDYKKV